MPPGRAALSATWAALPFLTLGWATPFTFTAAAIWRRSAHLVVSSLIYVGIFVLQVVLARDLDGASDTQRNIFGACVFVQALVGCAHAFLIRRRVFDPAGYAGISGNEAAIERVRRQRLLRRKARDLARSDPGLARELRIGRPDLPRHYDDGGLVDVNHASAEALTLLPGVTVPLAAQIDKAREEVGEFVSAEELSVVAKLPPVLTPDLVEYAIFLR
jgi:hypothetical protein